MTLFEEVAPSFLEEEVFGTRLLRLTSFLRTPVSWLELPSVEFLLAFSEEGVVEGGD